MPVIERQAREARELVQAQLQRDGIVYDAIVRQVIARTEPS
jgi:hypothetical protein